MIGWTSRTFSPSSVAQQPQHPVGGGVVRAEVDREQLGLELELGARDRLLDALR